MQITQLDLPPEMIDLGVGQPDLALLPLDLIRQAATHRLGFDDPAPLQYGTEQGNAYFRRALAAFLSEGYGGAVDPRHLFVTAGATYGLDLICTYFARPGDTVFVEEPTYFLALRIFADRRLNVVSLPIDHRGLVPEALEEKLASVRPAFVYTVPTFHNPSGTTLSAHRREQLVRLSRRHGFLIVADEVYHLLNYTLKPPPPLAFFDTGGTVLSMGSFSKILAPGIRLGWIQAAPSLLGRLARGGLLLSSGGMNPFTSTIVESALELGLLAAHVERLKQAYHRRATALAEALGRQLPAWAAFQPPAGGFFIWLALPPDMDAEALQPAARANNVNFQPGFRFSAGGALKSFLRLSFVYYAEDRLREGAERLAAVLKNVGRK
jgi:2-aminoadipate transaminase